MTQDVSANRPEWIVANFAGLERSLNGSCGSALHVTRREAMTAFLGQGFPTPANEDWKYTNLSSLAGAGYVNPSQPDDSLLAKVKGRLENSISAGLNGWQVVFVNGHFIPDLSNIDDLPRGLTISTLGNIAGPHTKNDSLSQAFLAGLGKLASRSNSSLIQMNTALFQDGAFIQVDSNLKIDRPIGLVFLNLEGSELSSKAVVPFAAHGRILIQVGTGTEVQFTEEYLGTGKYFVNPVTELKIEDSAKVNYLKIQADSQTAVHLGSMHAEIGADAKFECLTLSLGASLGRNEIQVQLAGQNAFCKLNGLTLVGGKQHLDNTTILNHAVPHCESSQLYKGVYADDSSGVFSGTIIVDPQAQKTNAFQANKALLLTDRASIQSRPQLKIWADDVKCTHGATVGQLDDEALFYLRSRGIGLASARNILIHAFIGEVLEQIGPCRLLESLKGLLASGLPD